jgi:hypothetical protein
MIYNCIGTIKIGLAGHKPNMPLELTDEHACMISPFFTGSYPILILFVVFRARSYVEARKHTSALVSGSSLK